MPTPILALLLVMQQPAQQSTPTIVRVAVTPASPVVVAGDTLRLHARALDASGRPIEGALILFQAAGGYFEAHVDSAGLVSSGAVGTLPIVVSAVAPGAKPVIERVSVRMVPAPAARVEIAPRVTRLLAGQRVRLDASSYSRAGDRRDDRIEWQSSVPQIARVAAGGVLNAIAPGRATITASTGAASRALQIEVLAADIGSIDITPSLTQARTGDVIRFKSSVKDRAGKEITGLEPTWLFSPGRGEIDDAGAFVAYEPGTYQVTASYGARTADATVTVASRDVQRVARVVGRVPRSALFTSEVWLHPNGKVAYLGTALGGDRVYAIDVSNPAAPAIVDSIVVNARTVNDVMTTPDGNYMVITREGADNRKNGIVIADTHDPLHPKPLSEFTDGVTSGVHSAFIHQQEKYGTHVYLTNDGTGELDIVDITDPAHPKGVGKWRPKQTPAGVMLHDIDVQNGLVYASWWNDGLVILDVGNGIKGGRPDKPVLVSQFKYNLDSLYKDVALEGGPGFIRGTHTAWRHGRYVFIADEVFGNSAAQALFQGQVSRAHGRLQVVDVSDIEHPKSVAWYEPEFGGVHNVWVAGDTLYLGAYNAGFHAFDISGELRGDLRAQGREIANLYTGAPDGKNPNAAMAWGTVVKNDLAYVNDVNSGLWIVRLEPKSRVVP
ncbi:MAG TPA: Ig-like domain-containing protein [Gemmatimonadaceae bacterium]|nr:Ig-like domain-containing protein [Gemmatimonadaceae bacterium]